ncbi:hypothetical protein [Sicyoidochytrium minutum DNA virus]|nr:hypothetical protein [Sicyoidochytrium minutum DNA virus]BDC16929.1 hypothetical protein [Sicyoidochytrium minutum DNA virus]
MRIVNKNESHLGLPTERSF